MIKRLMYYYSVVHLQVGGTYIVALSLAAFVIEIGLAAEKKRGADNTVRISLILRTILWIAALTPLGLVAANLFFGGEPNNPVLFAFIPAAACAAYGAVLVWERRPRVSTLFIIALVILIAAGQTGGFSLPSATTDARMREAEVAELEGIMDGYGLDFSEKSPVTIVASEAVSSRLAEYRDDLKIYIFEEWVREPISIESGGIVTSLGADFLICTYDEADRGVVNGIEGCTWIGQTEHFVIFYVPKQGAYAA